MRVLGNKIHAINSKNGGRTPSGASRVPGFRHIKTRILRDQESSETEESQRQTLFTGLLESDEKGVNV